MSIATDTEAPIKPQPPIFRQIAAFVFGLIFAFSNGYSGLELVFALAGAPLLFAGMVRLYTATYRVASSFINNCLVQVAAGFCAVGAVVMVLLMPAFRKSTTFGVILTVVLMLCEVVVFIRDVMSWKKTYKT